MGIIKRIREARERKQELRRTILQDYFNTLPRGTLVTWTRYGVLPDLPSEIPGPATVNAHRPKADRETGYAAHEGEDRSRNSRRRLSPASQDRTHDLPAQTRRG